MKVILVVLAALSVVLVAGGAWYVLSGRADKLARTARLFREAQARPGAKQVGAMPACGVGAIFATHDFWESSPELRDRYPDVDDLPATLVLCGVRKHVEPPSTEAVAQVYANAVQPPEGFVVVVFRQCIGEALFKADAFWPSSPDGPRAAHD